MLRSLAFLDVLTYSRFFLSDSLWSASPQIMTQKLTANCTMMSPHFQPAWDRSFQIAHQANSFTPHDSMTSSSVLCRQRLPRLFVTHAYSRVLVFNVACSFIAIFFIALLMSLQTLGCNGILLSSRRLIMLQGRAEFHLSGMIRCSCVWLPDCSLRLLRACDAQPCSCLRQRRVYVADHCWWPWCLQEKQARDFFPPVIVLLNFL